MGGFGGQKESEWDNAITHPGSLEDQKSTAAS